MYMFWFLVLCLWSDLGSWLFFYAFNLWSVPGFVFLGLVGFSFSIAIFLFTSCGLYLVLRRAS